MALLPVQPATQSGTAVAFQAADAAGDTLPPGEDLVLEVKNGSAAAVTVTIAGQTPCNHGVVHDVGVSVPAGAERRIGPLPAQRFADRATGLVEVTYSAAASVTVAATRV